MEKITVKTTGNFQLFDLYQGEMISDTPVEVLKTPFVDMHLNGGKLTKASASAAKEDAPPIEEVKKEEVNHARSPGRPPKA